MKNGFFQLVHKEDGTYIRLIPPEGGGEPLSLDEVREYLDTRGILYDGGSLKEALEELSSEKLVQLNGSYAYPCRESYTLRVSPDRMRAVVRFYAPSSVISSAPAEGA